jgi:predicted amidophosphoribosyltransferase
MHIYGAKTMVYCSNCGAKIDEEAFFCPKCGTKTPMGKSANAPYPSDELRDAFYKVGIELERAFTMAARETHAAFKRVSEDIKQKPASTTTAETMACPNCGTKNPSGSIFCNNCGTRLSTTEESRGST